MLRPLPSIVIRVSCCALVLAGTQCSLITVPVETAGKVVQTTVSTAGDVVQAPFKAAGGRDNSSNTQTQSRQQPAPASDPTQQRP